MSDLLNSASLVMIPSGYKEDTVFSQIPTDGSGDMAFTRASNGTRVNSAGLVEVCPWNMAQQSETFDNAAWVKGGGLSVSTNTTTAPNGTTTADTLDDQNSGAYGNIEQNFVFVAGGYTFSIYIKKTSGSLTHYPGLEMCSKGSYLIFNTTTGAYVESGGTNYTVNVENVGDYWRVSITANTSGGTQIIGVWPAISSNGTSISHSATGSNVFWGAQLNIGSTAKPYFPTTDRLNVPRLTYQNGGGGCPSLLLEKQSTNYVYPSEDFSAWNLYLSATISTNTTISPDGTQNADTLNFAVSSSSQLYSNQGTGTSAQYTASIYAKSSSGKKFRFKFSTPSGDLFSSDLTTTSEWQRFTYTYTERIYQVGICNESAGGTGTIQIWGAQLEDGAYPTSYIPTTSSSATRVADACLKTGISSLIGQTEGVIFYDLPPTTFNNSLGTFVLVELNGNIGAGYAHLYKPTGANQVIFQVANAGTLQCSLVFSLNDNTRYKVAAVYKNNRFELYVNGVLRASDYSGTLASITMDKIQVAGDSFNANSQLSTNQLVLFKTALTQSECEQLTTI